MRKLVVSEYVTLDGVMEAPNKWSFPFWNEEAAQFKFDELAASDALLLGRVTYNGFAKAWPTMEKEVTEGSFASMMNGIAKYVVSTTLKRADWNNSTIISANVADEIFKLKMQEGKDILVGGSADLVDTLQANDLVDEYRFLLYPVVVGSGKRLFKDGNAMKSLRLVSAKTTEKGIVMLTYEPDEKSS